MQCWNGLACIPTELLCALHGLCSQDVVLYAGAAAAIVLGTSMSDTRPARLPALLILLATVVLERTVLRLVPFWISDSVSLAKDSGSRGCNAVGAG